MKLFDVNVLVNAYREDTQHHEPCRQVIEDAVASPVAFGLTSVVLSGFLSIVTHRRIFKTPSSLSDAFEFIDILAGMAQAVPITPGGRHWNIFSELCLDARATGNLVPDAYLAAIAIESGCDLVTTDRDFARFSGLSWIDPLAT